MDVDSSRLNPVENTLSQARTDEAVGHMDIDMSDNDASATAEFAVVVIAEEEATEVPAEEATEVPSEMDFEVSGGVQPVSRGHSDHDHEAQSGTGSGGANSLCGVAVDARDGEGLAMTVESLLQLLQSLYFLPLLPQYVFIGE